MIFDRFGRAGRRAADAAYRVTLGRAFGLTEQAIRAAVDQAFHVLSLAADEARSKDLPAGTISLGVAVNLGLIQLEMKMDVPTRGAVAVLDPPPSAAAGTGPG